MRVVNPYKYMFRIDSCQKRPCALTVIMWDTYDIRSVYKKYIHIHIYTYIHTYIQTDRQTYNVIRMCDCNTLSCTHTIVLIYIQNLTCSNKHITMHYAVLNHHCTYHHWKVIGIMDQVPGRVWTAQPKFKLFLTGGGLPPRTPPLKSAWKSPFGLEASQSLYRVTLQGRLSKLRKYKSSAKHKFMCFFYKSVAGDPGEVEMEQRLLGVGPIAAFPRTVEIEPAKTHIQMLPYEHYNNKNGVSLGSISTAHGNAPIDSISQALKPIQQGTTLVIRIWCMRGSYTDVGYFQRHGIANL